ncbi:MAG TPA: DUF433 domain-containing protein [Streptosporangiaceae bacterium]|jgi:uncharacterized protein (DUF433 family)
MTALEAARQLRIPPTTLIRWLEGEHRGGTWYPPVLREEATGQPEITWGEAVEARYLRAYRAKNVPMQRLRPFIADMRQRFGVPYPLAHFQPFASGRRLLLEVQDQLRLPGSLRMIYEVSTGQLILDPRVVGFLDRVEFADSPGQEAVRIRPAGKESPVVIDPRVSSGASTVYGTRTEILAEQASVGATVDEIAEDFALPLAVVKAALSYEWSTPVAA